MNALRQWFFALERRERVMVAAAAAVVVIALFYYALWMPLGNALANARQNVATQATQASWMLGIRDQAQLLRASGQSAQPQDAGESILQIVDSSSGNSAVGNAITHIEPQNDNEAVVSLSAASFDALVYWLHTLKTTYGISVSQATISAENNHPGVVDARLTLVRGAA